MNQKVVNTRMLEKWIEDKIKKIIIIFINYCRFRPRGLYISHTFQHTTRSSSSGTTQSSPLWSQGMSCCGENHLVKIQLCTSFAPALQVGQKYEKWSPCVNMRMCYCSQWEWRTHRCWVSAVDGVGWSGCMMYRPVRWQLPSTTRNIIQD